MPTIQDTVNAIEKKIQDTANAIDKTSSSVAKSAINNTLYYTGNKTAEQLKQEALFENIDLLATTLKSNDAQAKIQEVIDKIPHKNTSIPQNTEFSPLNKNVETYLLEGLFSQIVQNPDSVTFNVTYDDKGKQKILVSTENPIQYLSPLHTKDNKMTVDLMEIEVKDVDVSEVFARADLRHLNLDKTLMDKYAALQESAKSPQWFYNNIKKAIEGINDSIQKSDNNDEKALLNKKLRSLEELQGLSYGEQIALRKYTGPDYQIINGLTRGTNLVLNDHNNSQAKQVKNAFIDVLVVQNIVTNLNHPIDYPTLRVERTSRMDNLKDKAQNNSISEEKGLMSTSDKLLNNFGSEDGAINFILNKPLGIDVHSISVYPGESEILVPQSQLQFTKFVHGVHGNDFPKKRLLLEANRINVETDERKEQAKIAGPFDIKKHEYNITIEPNTDNIVAEYSQTTVIKKGSVLQDIKYDTVTEQPANNDDIVQKIASATVLKSQVEQDKRLKSECQNLAAKMFGAEPKAYKTQSVAKQPTGMILS